MRSVDFANTIYLSRGGDTGGLLCRGKTVGNNDVYTGSMSFNIFITYGILLFFV